MPPNALASNEAVVPLRMAASAAPQPVRPVPLMLNALPDCPPSTGINAAVFIGVIMPGLASFEKSQLPLAVLPAGANMVFASSIASMTLFAPSPPFLAPGIGLQAGAPPAPGVPPVDVAPAVVGPAPAVVGPAPAVVGPWPAVTGPLP